MPEERVHQDQGRQTHCSFLAHSPAQHHTPWYMGSSSACSLSLKINEALKAEWPHHITCSVHTLLCAARSGAKAGCGCPTARKGSRRSMARTKSIIVAYMDLLETH